MNSYSLSGAVWVRILVAVALGAIIGLQREIDDQQAGLRTHLSVCLGAALFGIVSTAGFSEFEGRPSDTNVRIDVTRVASQVVVGIGFVGAGLIVRRGADVRNLTTAVSLWVTAAVGVAVGVGQIAVAAVTSAALLVGLALLRPPRDWLRQRLTRKNTEVRIGFRSSADADAAQRLLGELPGVTSSRLLGVQKVDGYIECRLEVRTEPGAEPAVCTQPLTDREDVEYVMFEELQQVASPGGRS